MEWHQMMSVGIAEFDADHQQVLVLLGEIQQALQNNDVERASKQAAELMRVALSHTKREEAFLRSIDYPEVELVTGAQKESLERIAQLAKQFEIDTIAANDAILEMRLNFIDYLLQADINYKSFVRKAGLSNC